MRYCTNRVNRKLQVYNQYGKEVVKTYVIFIQIKVLKKVLGFLLCKIKNNICATYLNSFVKQNIPALQN